MSKVIDGYEVKAGDKFTYCGREYEAVRDTRGEFRPYIAVKTLDGLGTTEIVLGHGDTVELLS